MLGKTRVLAVSRDPVLVSFLQKELDSFEYEIVHTEHNGIQLKEVLETEKPEFIVMDIVMPSLDGIGICLQLRQWTQTPVVMLSTWGTGNGTVRGLNLSSDNYLTKPFGGDVLKRRIKDSLKRNDLVGATSGHRA
jgi:two-component system, OmpR family, KDP operon response regulator KdpE